MLLICDVGDYWIFFESYIISTFWRRKGDKDKERRYRGEEFI